MPEPSMVAEALALGRNGYHGQIFRVCQQLLHKGLIIALIHPDTVGVIVDITLGRVGQLEADIQKILIAVGVEVLRQVYILVRKLLHHFIQLALSRRPME